MSMEKIKSYPLPMIRAYEEFEREGNPFRKVHRLIDLIEVFIKFHTVLVIGRYFELEKISDRIKAIFVQGLKTPSLGIWWSFAREIAKELKEIEDNDSLKPIIKVLIKNGKIFTLMESKNNLINFRNKYAHGGTPPDKRCKKHIEKYGEKFFKVFFEADYLKNLSLECSTNKKLYKIKREIKGVGNANKEDCKLIVDNLKFSIYPLLVLKEDEDGERRFYYHNDLKASYASILNYEDSLHKKDKELKDKINEKFPLREWRKKGIELEDRFKDRIELLTETFKGRKKEIREIVDFLSKKRGGYLMIWGGPGIGKSALLARAVKVLSWSDEVREEAGVKGGIGKDKFKIIEYFIRRDMGTNNTEDYLDYMYQRLTNISKKTVERGKTVKEKRRAYIEQLKLISEELKDDEKIVIIVDGLDEGTEDFNLLDSLVREYIDKVLVIYSSRENNIVRENVYDNLEREKHQEMTLTGLSKVETRALLYEYVNKYELEEQYVEALRERSEGNPLFIKLVCEGILDGIYKLNDSTNLPKGLEEIYKKIISRYKREYKDIRVFDLLIILATGKDYFSRDMLSKIMEEKTEEVERTLDISMEILIENPLTEEILDYQLFHESLREYLIKNYKGDLDKWKERICEWIMGWKGLKRESLDYALKYFFNHFEELYRMRIEEGKDEEAEKIYKYLVESIEDEGFREKVFEVTGNDSSLRYGYRLIQRIILERGKKEEDRFLEYSLRINDEGERRADAQFKRLIREAQQGDLSNILRLSMMGGTSRERLLYIIRGLWEAPERMRVPEELKRITKEWTEELSDRTLTTLTNLSINRFKELRR